MGKGFAKIYQSEADNPKLWENATLYLVYQKLKTVAWWPEGTIKRPCRALAKRLAVSINTLRKAVAGLEELGLVEVSLSDRNTWALRVKYVEADSAPAQTAPQIGPQPAAGVNLLNAPKNAPSPVLAAPEPTLSEPEPEEKEPADEPVLLTVSKNDTPAYQNLTQSVSKFDTPAYQNLIQQPYIDNNIINNNINTPHNPPETQKDAGFALFWQAYPNKKGKQAALKKWTTGKYDPALILPTLEKQKKLRDWVKADGKFIPHARTYLNQRRYEDLLPEGEEHYVLDFKQPKTEREVLLTAWLEATNPDLLKNDNQKINSAFEPDRILFEQIVAKCGGNLQEAFSVLRHGWRLGCASLRAIAERAASYIDDLRENKNDI